MLVALSSILLRHSVLAPGFPRLPRMGYGFEDAEESYKWGDIFDKGG
jgi:hypothetical protein